MRESTVKWSMSSVAWAVLGVTTALATTATAATCQRSITADVVALDQVVFYNRYGAVNPQSTIYALREDVVDMSGVPCGQGGACTPGNVVLRPDKRPRPITLRMNVGDCLTVKFQNLLAGFPPPNPLAPAIPNADVPLTRNVGMHVNGMQLVSNISDDGSNVGANPSGLAAPGGTSGGADHGAVDAPQLAIDQARVDAGGPESGEDRAQCPVIVPGIEEVPGGGPGAELGG